MKDEKSLIDLFAERTGRKYIVPDIAEVLEEAPSQDLDIIAKAEKLKDSIIQYIRDTARAYNIMTAEVVDILNSLFSDKNAIEELKEEMRKEGQMNREKGYKLRKINRKEDLMECGYGWLLKYFPFDRLAGGYIDESEQVVEFEPTEKRKDVIFLSIVYGRLYPTKTSAVVGKDGNLYIPEDEFDKLF